MCCYVILTGVSIILSTSLVSVECRRNNIPIKHFCVDTEIDLFRILEAQTLINQLYLSGYISGASETPNKKNALLSVAEYFYQFKIMCTSCDVK